MKNSRTFGISALFCASLQIADAQTPLTTYSTHIAEALTLIGKGNVTDDQMNDAARRIVSLESNEEGFLDYYSRASAFKSFLKTAEETIANHEPGSAPSSAGSSSLVAKSAVTDVLGTAVDAGALTQSSSGNTVTFVGNARGVYRYLTGSEVYQYCSYLVKCDNFLSSNARRLTASISLDTTNSSTTSAATSGTTSNTSASTPATSLSGSNSRMSSWGVQYQLPLPNADPTSAAFHSAWNKATGSLPAAAVAAAKTLNQNLSAAFGKAEDDSEYKQWRTTATSQIAKKLGSTPTPGQADIESSLHSLLQGLVQILQKNNDISDDQMNKLLSAYQQFFASRQNVINSVTGTLPGLSLAYTNAHPLNQANVSNFKLIFQFQPKPGKVTLSANVAADIYDHLPSGTAVGRWRDLQVSTQADFTLPTQYGNPVLSFAGYYQYMATKAVLQIAAGNTVPGTNIMLPGSAPMLLAPAGNIAIAQAMLTFPLKNSSTKIPIGISWANRTELLTGSVVRAHIGLNFDFDSLFIK